MAITAEHNDIELIIKPVMDKGALERATNGLKTATKMAMEDKEVLQRILGVLEKEVGLEKAVGMARKDGARAAAKYTKDLNSRLDSTNKYLEKSNKQYKQNVSNLTTINTLLGRQESLMSRLSGTSHVNVKDTAKEELQEFIKSKNKRYAAEELFAQKTAALNKRMQNEARNALSIQKRNALRADAIAQARWKREYANIKRRERKEKEANNTSFFSSKVDHSGQPKSWHKHLNLIESTAIVAKYGAISQALYGIQSATKALIAESNRFDDAIYKNMAVLQVSSTMAKSLAVNSRKVAIEYGGTIAELDEVTLTLGRAGVASYKLAAATKAVAEMATITGDSLADSSKVISTFNTNFEETGVTISELTDKLAFVANATKMSTADLGTFANYGLQTARSLNLTLDTTGALVAMLSRLGFSASTIGTEMQKLDPIFTSNSKAIKNFWDVLYRGNGDSARKDLLKRMLNGDEKALIDFSKKLKAQPFAEFSAGADGLNIRLKRMLLALGTGSDLLQKFSRDIKTAGSAELQAGVNALGASKMLERAQAALLVNSDYVTTALLDVITGRDKVLKLNDKLVTTNLRISTLKDQLATLDKSDPAYKGKVAQLKEALGSASTTTDTLKKALKKIDTQFDNLTLSGARFAKGAITAGGTIYDSFLGVELVLKSIQYVLLEMDSAILHLMEPAFISIDMTIKAYNKLAPIMGKAKIEALNLMDLPSDMNKKAKVVLDQIVDLTSKIADQPGAKAAIKLNAQLDKAATEVNKKRKEAVKTAKAEIEAKAKIKNLDERTKSAKEILVKLENEQLAAQAKYAIAREKAGRDTKTEIQLENIRHAQQEAILKQKQKIVNLQLLSTTSKDAQNRLDALKYQEDIKHANTLYNLENRTKGKSKNDQLLNFQSKFMANQTIINSNGNDAVTIAIAHLAALHATQFGLTEVKDQQKRILDIQKAQIALHNAEFKASQFELSMKIKLLDAQLQLNAAQQDYSANSTGTAAAIGRSANALLAIDNQQINQKKASLELDKQHKADVEKYGTTSIKAGKLQTKYLHEKGVLEQKNIQAQLQGYGQLAGAMSGMFAEGSKGAKAALLAQQALAVASGVAVILNVGTSGDGYTALARVAAAIGVVAGILSMAGIAFGGHGGGVSKGSAEHTANATTAQREVDAITGRLDRQIKLLEIIGKSGSESYAGIKKSRANLEYGKTINREKIAADIRFNVFDRDYEYDSRVYAQKAADTFYKTQSKYSQDYKDGKPNSHIFLKDLEDFIAHGSVKDIEAYLGSNNVNDIFTGGDADDIKLLGKLKDNIIDYADAVSSTNKLLLEKVKDWQDTYDKLSGDNFFSTKRLREATSKTDALMLDTGAKTYEELFKKLGGITLDISGLEAAIASNDLNRIEKETIKVNNVLKTLGVSANYSAVDLIDMADSLNAVSEAAVTSKNNTKEFVDSFKTEEQLLQDQANSVHSHVATTYEELGKLFNALKGGVGGLTNKEKDFLDANKAFIEDLNSKKVQGLDTALQSLYSTIDSLRGAAGTSQESLALYYQSMAKTKQLLANKDYDAYEKSLKDTLKYSSELNNSDNFTSGAKQNYEQLLAANQLSDMANSTLTQIDILKVIATNTGVIAGTGTTYAVGGYTHAIGKRDATGQRVAGIVHDNEWVAPKWMVAGNPGLFNSLEHKRQTRGFAQGGFTSGGPTSARGTQVTLKDVIFELRELKQLQVKQTADGKRSLDTQRALLSEVSENNEKGVY